MAAAAAAAMNGKASSNKVNPAPQRASSTVTPEHSARLLPHELIRLFFHFVREGKVEDARQLLRLRPALINELDECLFSPVHYAVKHGHPEMLRFLLLAGGNVNQRGKEGVRPLHVAALLKNIPVLRELLHSRRIKVDATDDKGQTALHLAVRRNNKEAVRILLEHKASLQIKEIDSSSVLHHPTRKNNVELYQLLVADSELVSTADKYGITPVMTAASEGSCDLLEYFVKVYCRSNASAQPLVNARDMEGNTPLHFAARNNRTAMIAALRSHGARVNAANEAGSKPLHEASTLGYTETAEQLLDLGASLESVDKKLKTPLHRAIISKQEAMAELLLSRNASASAQDSDFMTPLSWACRRGLKKIAAALLKAAPETLTLKDIDSRTSLHWAIIVNSPQIAGMLLEIPECEQIISNSDARDKSPMHYAVEQNNAQLLKTLVSRGADPRVVDTFGRTPMQLAVKLGFLELLKEIEALEPDTKRSAIRHRDFTGKTSFLTAAKEGHAEILELLVSQGADFTSKDDCGKTALMLASGRGHASIVTALIDRGVDLNISDVNKNTALHYACKHTEDTACLQLLLENGAELQENYNRETPVDVAVLSGNELALQLLFSDEYCDTVMNFRRESGHTHLDVLIQHSPQTAMHLLNRCTAESSGDHLDRNFMVAYDFSLIDPGPDDPSSKSQRYFALRTMVQEKREDLLMHPLCQTLLTLKWGSARVFFIADLLFYLLFLACITAFIIDNGPLPPTLIDDSTGCKNTSTSSSYTGTRQKLTSASILIEKYVVIVFLSIRLLIEVVKFLFKRLQYIKNYENYFFIVLYALSYVFIWPPDSEPCRYNWIVGIFAIILAWSLLIFMLEHLPIAGIYSLMFQTVIVSVIKVFLLLSFIIIGYALAFYIGLNEETPFRNFGYALLKTIDMTVGELDFVTYFINSTLGTNMRITLLIVFVLFVTIVPISLMNLLVGIAVGDISGISKEASLQMLKLRVDLIYELETNLPNYVQRKFYKKHMQVYPNTPRGFFAEQLWPYELYYREWLQKVASDTAEITSEERLASIEDQLRQISAKLQAQGREKSR